MKHERIKGRKIDREILLIRDRRVGVKVKSRFTPLINKRVNTL